jgi:hypothetical protein
VKDWSGLQRKRSWLNFEEKPQHLEKLRKATKKLDEDNRCHGRESNRTSAEYKAAAYIMNDPVSIEVMEQDY